MTEEEESLQQTSKKRAVSALFDLDTQDLPGAGCVSLVLRGGVPPAAAPVKLRVG